MIALEFGGLRLTQALAGRKGVVVVPALPGSDQLRERLFSTIKVFKRAKDGCVSKTDR